MRKAKRRKEGRDTYAARNIQRHCVQNAIATRGRCTCSRAVLLVLGMVAVDGFCSIVGAGSVMVKVRWTMQ